MIKRFSFLFLGIGLLLFVNSCKKPNDDKSNKLATPELLLPANNSTYTVEFNDYLDWAGVINATEYFIEVATNLDFSNIIDSYTSEDSKIMYQYSNYTESSITLYWRVKAISPGFETSNYSTVFSFTVNPYIYTSTDIYLLSPSDGSSNVSLNHTFRCEDLPDATSYTFFFRELGGGGVTISETSSTNQTTASQLITDMYYQWWVTANLDGGGTVTSPIWDFFTETPSSAKNGTYEGTANGPMYITMGSSVVIDTNFTALPISINIQETSQGSGYFYVTYNITINGIPLSPVVEGIEFGNTISIYNETWNYALLGIDIVISDEIIFNTPNSISGNVYMSEPSGSSTIVNGDLNYTANRQ